MLGYLCTRWPQKSYIPTNLWILRLGLSHQSRPKKPTSNLSMFHQADRTNNQFSFAAKPLHWKTPTPCIGLKAFINFVWRWKFMTETEICATEMCNRNPETTQWREMFKHAGVTQGHWTSTLEAALLLSTWHWHHYEPRYSESMKKWLEVIVRYPKACNLFVLVTSGSYRSETWDSKFRLFHCGQHSVFALENANCQWPRRGSPMLF